MGMINIPGMMTGQIMAGTPIMEAVMYQQCIMFMIAASSTLGVIMAVTACMLILIDKEQIMRQDRIYDNKTFSFSKLKCKILSLKFCCKKSRSKKTVDDIVP